MKRSLFDAHPEPGIVIIRRCPILTADFVGQNAMNATVFTRTPQPPAKALPEKVALLMHEARWLLVGAFGLYLSLVLWGFDRADSGWSHVSANATACRK